MNNSLFIKVAETPQERKEAYSVRNKVFVAEQHVPPEAEVDQYEEDAVHIVLYNDQHEPVGAGRYRILDGAAKAERICVLANGRGHGYGAIIMNFLEKHAAEQHLKQVKLSAQAHAIPFYERLGYRIISEEFFEQNIPHRKMIKDL